MCPSRNSPGRNAASRAGSALQQFRVVLFFPAVRAWAAAVPDAASSPVILPHETSGVFDRLARCEALLTATELARLLRFTLAPASRGLSRPHSIWPSFHSAGKRGQQDSPKGAFLVLCLEHRKVDGWAVRFNGKIAWSAGFPGSLRDRVYCPFFDQTPWFWILGGQLSRRKRRHAGVIQW